MKHFTTESDVFAISFKATVVLYIRHEFTIRLSVCSVVLVLVAVNVKAGDKLRCNKI